MKQDNNLLGASGLLTTYSLVTICNKVTAQAGKESGPRLVLLSNGFVLPCCIPSLELPGLHIIVIAPCKPISVHETDRAKIHSTNASCVCHSGHSGDSKRKQRNRPKQARIRKHVVLRGLGRGVLSLCH